MRGWSQKATRVVVKCDHPPAHRALAELAGRQHGVVSLGQLTALGLGPRGAQHRATFHRLRRVHRGVYAVGGAPLSRDGARMAAVLAGGPGARGNQVSAAALWAFRRADPTPSHVVVPGRGRRGPPGVHIHRTRRLDPRDCTEVRGIPVTSVALTLVDLAETLDAQSLATAVHEAEVHRLFDANQFTRFAGRRGVHRLHALLEDPSLSTVSQEEFDNRFLALCRTHHLPLPRMHVHLPAGDQLLEVDALWSERKSASSSTARSSITRAEPSAVTASATSPWPRRDTWWPA